MSAEAWDAQELQRRLARLEARRAGRPEPDWTNVTDGQIGTYFTKDEAYAAACDSEGVDPTLPLPERLARLRDIHQGSGLMYEERKRKEAHQRRRYAALFHKDLKEKLGQ